MMETKMGKIEIDGCWYHAQYVYDDDDGTVIGLDPILDEEGDLIPTTECICHAYEPSECCCGAWDDVNDWYYD